MKRLLIASIVLCAISIVVSAQDSIAFVTHLPETFDDLQLEQQGSYTLTDDGESFALIATDLEDSYFLCIGQLVDSRDEDNCTPLPDEEFLHTASRLNWSPDGNYIVLFQNIFRSTDVPESDMWLYDVASETFTNLNPDGTDYLDVYNDENTRVDFEPVWHPNASELYFFTFLPVALQIELNKYDLERDELSTLQVYEELDFELIRYGASNAMFEWGVFNYPVMSSDGSQMAYAISGPGGIEEGRASILIIDMVTFDLTTITSLNAFEIGVPAFNERDFSRSIEIFDVLWVNNDTGLVISAGDWRFSDRVMRNIYYLDLETGDISAYIPFSELASSASENVYNANLGGIPVAMQPYQVFISEETDTLYWTSQYENDNIRWHNLYSMSLSPETNEPAQFIATLDAPLTPFAPIYVTTLVNNQAMVGQNFLLTILPVTGE